MRTQEELFYEWKSECDKLSMIGNIIQNDYKRMLSDGMVTKDEIKSQTKEHEIIMTENLIRISSLWEEIKKFTEIVIGESVCGH